MLNIFVYDAGNFVPDYNYSLCKSLKENYPATNVTLFAYNKKKWNEKELNFKLCEIFFKYTDNIDVNNRIMKKVIKGIEYFFDLFKFIYYVLKRKPDVIHVQWLPVPLLDIIAFFFIKKLSSIKLVYTVHNILPHEKKFYHKYIYGLIYNLFDRLIIHTESNRKEFLSIYNEKHKFKLNVIPHGDYKKLYNDTDISIEKDNKINFLFFGLIKEYKGLDILFSAISKLKKKEYRDVKFKIYGKPIVNFDVYRKKIKNDNLDRYFDLRLEFIPEAEVSSIFRNSDVVILPYKKIYQSGVALLAYTFNIPVIASNVGGLSEIIDEGKTGFLFEPGNTDQLLKIIKKIINNPEILRDMKENIKNTQSDKYSWDNISKKTFKLYNDMFK